MRTRIGPLGPMVEGCRRPNHPDGGMPAPEAPRRWRDARTRAVWMVERGGARATRAASSAAGATRPDPLERAGPPLPQVRPEVRSPVDVGPARPHQ